MKNNPVGAGTRLTSFSLPRVRTGSSVNPRSTYGPAKHEQAAGCNPTSGDANDDESPLLAKWHYERREERDDDEDGECEAKKGVCAVVEAIDARSVQVSVEEAKHGGQCCSEW